MDEVNYCTEGVEWPLLNTLKDDKNASWWAKNTLGISFYKYICFIFKGRNPEDGEAGARLNNSDEILLQSKRYGSKLLDAVYYARKSLNQESNDSEKFSESNDLPNPVSQKIEQHENLKEIILSKLFNKLKSYTKKINS